MAKMPKSYPWAFPKSKAYGRRGIGKKFSILFAKKYHGGNVVWQIKSAVLPYHCKGKGFSR
tara:strand:- start:986 stop:1168 length:183 start_codon:yes stop_codon:yes gene_type:complete